MSSIQKKQIIGRLSEIVGPTHLSVTESDRDTYYDLKPSIVVWPATDSEVTKILQTCGELNISIGIIGAYTKKKHWLINDNRIRIALDTRRMMNILDLDETSLVVHVQAGIQFGQLEESVRRSGLYLGPFPKQIHPITIGGLLADPPANAYSPAVGHFSQNCLAISVATSNGFLFNTRVAPRRATGPDMTKLYLGSKGLLGVITSAVLKVFRLPEFELPLAFLFQNIEQALCATRAMFANNIRPSFCRILNANLAMQLLAPLGFPQTTWNPSNSPLPSTMLVVLSGQYPMVQSEQNFLEKTFNKLDVSELPNEYADNWWHHEKNITDTQKTPCSKLGIKLHFSHIFSLLKTLSSSDLHISIEQMDLHGGTVWILPKEIPSPSLLNIIPEEFKQNIITPNNNNSLLLTEKLRQKMDPLKMFLEHQPLQMKTFK